MRCESRRNGVACRVWANMANVAVIGAGFIGLSSAYWLMRDGHRVTLLDPQGPGEATSYGNAGTFAHYACIPVNNPSVFRGLPRFLLSKSSPLRIRWGYMPRLAPWLARFLFNSLPSRYPANVEALATILARAQDGYREMLAMPSLAGFVRERECLYLYSSQTSFDAASPALELRRSLGVEFDVLDRDEVRALEPQLAPLFERGVRFGGSWYLTDPRGFLRALHAALSEQGMEHHRMAVDSIEIRGHAVALGTSGNTSRNTSGPTRGSGTMREAADFEHVVLCTGAHSRELARQCGDVVPLDTERGYHVQFADTEGLISRPCGWAERGFYMTPMAGGVRAAGTVELAGFGPRRNASLLDLLSRSAQRALPALSQHANTAWLGFRPTLPDGLPVIGPSRASPRVIYAFGHQHLGVTLGGVTGSIVADLVAGRAPPIDLARYSARRF